MIETQDSICIWADQTFGPIKVWTTAFTRAQKECIELIDAIIADKPPAEIAMECADVVIVLTRPATHFGLAMTFGPNELVYDPAIDNMAIRANYYLGVCSLLVPGEQIQLHIKRIIALMFNIANNLSVPLGPVIDYKMSVNRARKWDLDGNGHGYHKKPPVLGVSTCPTADHPISGWTDIKS